MANYSNHDVLIEIRRDLAQLLAKMELKYLKQQGSVEEYINHFNSITNNPILSEEFRVYWFVKGLKTEISSVIERMYPSTTHEAMYLARLQEQLLEINSKVNQETQTKVGTNVMNNCAGFSASEFTQDVLSFPATDLNEGGEKPIHTDEAVSPSAGNQENQLEFLPIPTMHGEDANMLQSGIISVACGNCITGQIDNNPSVCEFDEVEDVGMRFLTLNDHGNEESDTSASVRSGICYEVEKEPMQIEVHTCGFDGNNSHLINLLEYHMDLAHGNCIKVMPWIENDTNNSTWQFHVPSGNNEEKVFLLEYEGNSIESREIKLSYMGLKNCKFPGIKFKRLSGEIGIMRSVLEILVNTLKESSSIPNEGLTQAHDFEFSSTKCQMTVHNRTKSYSLVGFSFKVLNCTCIPLSDSRSDNIPLEKSPYYFQNYHSQWVHREIDLEILYGQSPPIHVPYLPGESNNDMVDRSLQAREDHVVEEYTEPLFKTDEQNEEVLVHHVKLCPQPSIDPTIAARLVVKEYAHFTTSEVTQSMLDWKKWWNNPENVELYQFRGKDNVPFHTVMFPSTLLKTGESWTLMKTISVTEYLNYESGKFSKNKGVRVFGNDAKDTKIPPEVWRYYLLSNRPEASDTLSTWADLQAKLNSELLNNLGFYLVFPAAGRDRHNEFYKKILNEFKALATTQDPIFQYSESLHRVYEVKFPLMSRLLGFKEDSPIIFEEKSQMHDDVHKFFVKVMVIIWSWYYKDVMEGGRKIHPGSWNWEWKIAWKRH